MMIIIIIGIINKCKNLLQRDFFLVFQALFVSPWPVNLLFRYLTLIYYYSSKLNTHRSLHLPASQQLVATLLSNREYDGTVHAPFSTVSCVIV